MGGKASAPSADPGVSKALQKQADTGDKMLDFVIQSYKDNQPLVATAQANSQQDRERQNRLSDTAEARGNDAYNFYQTNGRPIINQALDDAKNWDNAGNVSKARSTAVADVQQGFDNAEQQQTRSLARMGINPNAGKFAALSNQMTAQKALGMAQAGNSAEGNLKLQGAQMRANGSNIANGLSSNSMSLAGQGSGMGGMANGMNGQALGFNQSTQNQMMSGMGAAGSSFGSNASGYQNLSNYNMNAAAQNNANSAGEWAGIGKLAGTAMMAFADGGPIKGPGTGTSDSVPASNVSNGQPIQLSNGEYVISADVVKAKGQEFFDKLQERYHKPSGNLGRAA